MDKIVVNTDALQSLANQAQRTSDELAEGVYALVRVYNNSSRMGSTATLRREMEKLLKYRRLLDQASGDFEELCSALKKVSSRFESTERAIKMNYDDFRSRESSHSRYTTQLSLNELALRALIGPAAPTARLCDLQFPQWLPLGGNQNNL